MIKVNFGCGACYLTALEQAATDGDFTLHAWTRMELLDQAARSVSGGEMVPWLRGLNENQLAPVRMRAGSEIDAILRTTGRLPWRKRISISRIWGRLRRDALRGIVYLIGGRVFRTAWDEGCFRQSGEVHRVMYDRVALARLLLQCGFAEPRVLSAEQSGIAGFGSSGLDMAGGQVRKPDSLFMEAIRP